MIDLSNPTPLAEALESLGRRAVMGTGLGSAALEGVPAALLRRAFVSAKVRQAGMALALKRGIEKAIKLELNGDRASFIAEMQSVAEALGARPAEDDPARGGIGDIGSRARLKLIYDVQTRLAQGEAQWRAAQDPDLLDAFPAFELVRGEGRKEWRHWPSRWEEAGGELILEDGGTYPEGRMFARANDPIWERISRFGVPWEPYDFNSGMVRRMVPRDEAEARGVIAPGEEVPPSDFEAREEAELERLLKNGSGDPDLDAALRQWLQPEPEPEKTIPPKRDGGTGDAARRDPSPDEAGRGGEPEGRALQAGESPEPAPSPAFPNDPLGLLADLVAGLVAVVAEREAAFAEAEASGADAGLLLLLREALAAVRAAANKARAALKEARGETDPPPPAAKKKAARKRAAKRAQKSNPKPETEN